MPHSFPVAAFKKGQTSGDEGPRPDNVAAVSEIVELLNEDLSKKVKITGNEHHAAQMNPYRVHSILEKIIHRFSEACLKKEINIISVLK